MAAVDDKAATAVEGETGNGLRTARESRNLTVHQLAQELHVADTLIEALERGEYAAVGEPVFVRGHLRNYARAVGLEERDVLAAYDQAQNKPAPPPLVTQHPSSMSLRAREWSLRAASIALLAILLGLALSWWAHRPATQERAVPAATISVAPPAVTAVNPLEDLAVSPPGPAPVAAASRPTESTAAVVSPKHDNPALQASVTTMQPTRIMQSKPANAPVANAAGMKPVAPANTPSASGAGQTHAKFTLDQASWIEVYDASGKRLYYDLAPAGESVDVSGAGPLQVFLGNAPGVAIELDGQPFSQAPYTRADNTARFRLGPGGGQGD